MSGVVSTLYVDENGESQETIIKWDPKFELGIPAIDAQHKYLVYICNDLYQAIMKNSRRDGETWEDSLKLALKDCANYVQTHFHDEEILMRASEYPDFARHRMEHEAFTRKVLETVQNFDSINMTKALEFVKFLYNWILSHIAHEDKLFVPQVLEHYRKSKEGK